jgi:hypothetical protein
MKINKQKIKKTIRELLIIVIAVVAVAKIVNWVQAGSLTVTNPPVGTLRTVQEIYDSLVGTFDSTSTTANINGNALQIMKCATQILRTGTCQ